MRTLSISICLLIAVAIWHPTPHQACGFHAQYFTEDFEAKWEQLKHDRLQREPAILELLRILKYVDPYNYAPDSPRWMSSENGREYARYTAERILASLGESGAKIVWNELLTVLRFYNNREVLKAREEWNSLLNRKLFARQELKALLNAQPDTHKYAQYFDAPGRDSLLYNELETIAWDNTVNAGSPTKKKSTYRPFTDADLKSIFDFQTRSRFSMPEFGSMDSTRFITTLVTKPEIRKVERLRIALQNYYELESKQKSIFTLLQRALREPQHSDLIPTEAYRASLERILLGIGKEARQVLTSAARTVDPNVRACAEKLYQRIEAGEMVDFPTISYEAATFSLDYEYVLCLWGMNDPAPDSEFAKTARAYFRQQGLAALPNLIRLLRLESFSLKTECLQALELASGTIAGDTPEQWQQWYDNILAHQRKIAYLKRSAEQADRLLEMKDVTIGISPEASAEFRNRAYLGRKTTEESLQELLSKLTGTEDAQEVEMNEKMQPELEDEDEEADRKKHD